jgi:uncharacterized membrane protein
MRLYYDDTIVDGKRVYQLGLEFPERSTADFWDFMYYSFTIAMCYQTSDVSITSVRIRRVTLTHAIYLFLFGSTHEFTQYNHTFPGSWSWLSITVGQYSFAAYDS